MKPFILPGTLDSAIARAKRGYKADARRLAKGIADLLESGDPIPESAKQYLVDGLRVIAAGRSGAEAFHTTGRKGIREDTNQSLREWVIAMDVQMRVADGRAKNVRQASLEIAADPDALVTDDAYIRKIHRKYFRVK